MNREGASAAAKKWATDCVPGDQVVMIPTADIRAVAEDAYDAGASAEREAILREIEDYIAAEEKAGNYQVPTFRLRDFAKNRLARKEGA